MQHTYIAFKKSNRTDSLMKSKNSPGIRDNNLQPFVFSRLAVTSLSLPKMLTELYLDLLGMAVLSFVFLL